MELGKIMDKFIPIWENKRYSKKYFIAGLRDIRMYWQFSLYPGFFWAGIHGVWTTLRVMIEGKPLRYKLEEYDENPTI